MQRPPLPISKHIVAKLLAVTALGSAVHLPSSAHATTEPWAERRIGFKLRVQVPHTAKRTSESAHWRSRGGATGAITMFDWGEVESGVAAIQAGSHTGTDVVVQLGLTPPILDVRDRLGRGLVLQGLGYFGYHYTNIDLPDIGGVELANVYESLGFDAGGEITYWFHLRFGLCLRAMLDIAVPVGANKEATVGEKAPVQEALDKSAFFGWTGTIGVAF